MTDEAALRLMAERGVAWTPTLSPLVAFLRGELPPERRWRVEEVEARLREILPAAQRLGVTVLPVPTPRDPWPTRWRCWPASASSHAMHSRRRAPRRTDFSGHQPLHVGHLADLVTYEHDPRLDPDVLRGPAAVVSRGRRIV